MLREVMKEMFSVWLKEQELDSSCNFEVSLEKYVQFEDLIVRNMREKNFLTNNPYSYIYSGNFYIRNQKYQEAIVQYGKALMINSTLAGFAYICRAVAQNELDKKEDTVSDLISGNDFLNGIIAEHKVLHDELKELKYCHLAKKIERKIILLQMTIESIQVLLSPCNGTSTSAQNDKKYRIICTKWQESSVVQQDADLYMKDAIELFQSGWIGPIELQEIKPLPLKVWNFIFGK